MACTMSAVQALGVDPDAEAGILVTFNEGPASKIKPPIYVVGPDRKLHPLTSEAAARKFFGDDWPSKVMHWGNKLGRPQQEHADTFMMPKGDPVTLETDWLPSTPIKPPNRTIRAKDGAMASVDSTGVDSTWFIVDGRRLLEIQGFISDKAFQEATADLPPDERDRLQRRASSLAAELHWRRRIENAERDQAGANRRAPTAEDRASALLRCKSHIAEFEQRIGKQSGLVVEADNPFMIWLPSINGERYAVGDSSNAIDEATYKEACKRVRRSLQIEKRRAAEPP